MRRLWSRRLSAIAAFDDLRTRPPSAIKRRVSLCWFNRTALFNNFHSERSQLLPFLFQAKQNNGAWLRCLVLIQLWKKKKRTPPMFEQNVFAVSAGWAAVVWRRHCGVVDWLLWAEMSRRAQNLFWIGFGRTWPVLPVADMRRDLDFYFYLFISFNKLSSLFLRPAVFFTICWWIRLSLLGIHLLSFQPSPLPLPGNIYCCLLH